MLACHNVILIISLLLQWFLEKVFLSCFLVTVWNLLTISSSFLEMT